MSEYRVTSECHQQSWSGIAAAWHQPLPDVGKSSARLAMGISFEQGEDGAVFLIDPPHVSLMQTSKGAENIGCAPSARVDFVAAPVWFEPPGVILLGVVTIVGASSRQHLIDGAEVLVSALRAELQTAAAQLADFHAFANASWPTAEQLVEIANE